MQYKTTQCNAMQCNMMQYDMVQYNTIQCNVIQNNARQDNTKLRPHKFLFDHSAGIAELVGVFSILSWVFLLIQTGLRNALKN